MRRVRNGRVKGGTRENRPPPGVEKACLFLKKKSGERNVVCSEEGIHGSRKKGESCPLSQASMGTTDSTQICQGSCFLPRKYFRPSSRQCKVRAWITWRFFGFPSVKGPLRLDCLFRS